jgi:hypothetical protein
MLAEWFTLQNIRWKIWRVWVDVSSLGRFGPGRKQEPPQGLKPWSLCALNGGLKPSSTLKQIFSPADILSSRFSLEQIFSPADILSSRYSFKQIFRQADKARWMESHQIRRGGWKVIEALWESHRSTWESHRRIMGESSKNYGKSSKNYGRVIEELWEVIEELWEVIEELWEVIEELWEVIKAFLDRYRNIP